MLVQQQSCKVDMAFPKHSIMQALSVLLLASVLVRCQAPLEAEEEEEDKTDAATTGAKSELIECPPECSCTAEGAVDCAGVDLIEFPAELSEMTRQLSLQVSHNVMHTQCYSSFLKTNFFAQIFGRRWFKTLCVIILSLSLFFWSPDARTTRSRR